MRREQPPAPLPDDRIHSILVAQIYARSPIGIIATLVNASILIFILWRQIPHGVLIAWFLAVFFVSSVRSALNLVFLKMPEGKRDYRRWSRLLVAGLLVSGVLWGATAVFLLPLHAVTHQVFIAFVLAGMVAGAVGVFSPLLHVFLAFSIPALVPITIRFFMLGDDIHIAMGAMIALFAMLTFSTARRISVSTRELIGLKETFSDQLAQRTAELERTNAQLRREIDERRQAEHALADSERRLSDIIDFLPDPTWVIDTDGRVIAWNRAMERITGVNKAAIIGKGDYAYALPFYGQRRPSLIDLALARDARYETDFLSLKEEDGMLIASESFHPSMGGGRYFASTASRLNDRKGVVVGAIQSMRDITAAKHSEQERERLIGELQAAVAKVRTLSGLLPICAFCKNIRDDKGYWKRIETYISENSEAEFSHSICPKCARARYPDLDIYADE